MGRHLCRHRPQEYVSVSITNSCYLHQMNRVEKIIQTEAFDAIAQWAEQFDYFAFYVNSKKDFFAAIDAQSVLTCASN